MSHKILVFIVNENIQSWTFQQSHVARLKSEFPDYEIINVSSVKDFLAELPTAEYCLVWKFKSEWYESAVCLKAVLTPAAGNEWARPDPTGRVPVYYGNWHGRIMKESLLSMMLYFNRNIPASIKKQKNKEWTRVPYDELSSLFGQEVFIIGYGHIGVECARLLKAFGCRVTGVKRSLDNLPDDTPADEVITFAELKNNIHRADHIVFLLPGSAEGLFDWEYFLALKPSVYLFNLGRGNCYSESDLVKAAKEKRIAGAGLDVFEREPLSPESELWDLPDVLITPHSSAVCVQYLDFFLDEAIPRIKTALDF